MFRQSSGVCGTVYVTQKYAKKYLETDDLCWCRELAVNIKLMPFTVETLIKANSFSFDDTSDVNELILVMSPCTKEMGLYECSNSKKLYQMLIDISHALKFLHSQGIWHRDVKESNILIRKSRFMLADFSHSSMNPYLKEYDIDIITDPYKPPEYFMGCHGNTVNISEKADIWSLGIVVINVLLGSYWYNYKKIAIPNIKYFIKEKFKGWIMEFLSQLNDKALASLLSGMLEFNPMERLSAEQVYKIVEDMSMIKKLNIKIPAPPICKIIPPSAEHYGNIDLALVGNKVKLILVTFEREKYCTNLGATLTLILYLLDNGFFKEINSEPTDSNSYGPPFKNRMQHIDALPLIITVSCLYLLESTVYDNIWGSGKDTEILYAVLKKLTPYFMFLENADLYDVTDEFYNVCLTYVKYLFSNCSKIIFNMKHIDYNHTYDDVVELFNEKQFRELSEKRNQIKKLMRSMRPVDDIYSPIFGALKNTMDDL